MRTTRLRLARFWAGVLGREVTEDPDEPDVIALLPSDDTGFRIEFAPTQEPKTGHNRMHFDLTSQLPGGAAGDGGAGRSSSAAGTSTSARARTTEHVVLADPEGNEFCVIEAGNNFLADTGLIGAMSCDGTQAGRLLLERGAGLAAGLGPGRGDRDPVTARRLEDLLGRSARGTEAREEPAASRHRSACRR